ncbi:hypothetical protein GCM10022415_27440 [Knoellia locipacati]|uniref:DUF4349 domain-containing protein n=1 Tax=Knoellia locipacati TaxID=882824 RepID=A0A512T3B7_9MICO|nr:DUF4349 domain-containing protein [Knoellia locipacati]GEQ14694.1 hypothetical protein KLO01_27410 [Knoellia locipacati]
MSTRGQHPARRVVGVALAGLLALGALSACGGGGNDTSGGDSGSSAAQDSAAKPADGDRAVGAVSPESARASAGQKLVRRAHLQLKVGSLPGAAERIRSIAAQQSGVVVTEELYSGEHGDTSGAITISVPASSLEATISLIEKVGDVQFRNSSSEDVTGTYVDTQARVTSMTASVARIRDLLAKASSVNDLVALENELSQRQAELDSLTAQLDSLKDSVSMSPISITLSTDDYEPVAAGGFLSGLRSGWKAFVTSAAVLATVVGAVLPFGVAIALVLVPVIWWVRRRRTHPAPLVAPVAPAGPAGPMPPASAG